MTALYPLKFKTIFKDKIWGGQKIKTYLGKDFGSLPNCGETWEISGVKTDVSVVDGGALNGESLADLLEQYKDELVGKKIYNHFGNIFPLLVKFIDANDWLSIQVHPNDELAKKRHNSFGKTEMWYIIESDPGSTLIAGFNQQIDEKIYLEKLNSGHLMDILNKETADAGDVFFLPAGRVHTIGKGLLLAEIQQTSDITYRIYDFDRVDDKGNKRELHTQEALAALD
jgi:mannose-6-phosphate isomerase